MEQPKVSIIYHGTADGIQALAKEVATGAEEVGAVVRVRRVPDHAVSAFAGVGNLATPDDVQWADAVVLGSPSRYGNLASPLKSYVETLEAVEGRRLGEIVWSGFASDDGVLHGGHEATLMTLFRALLHLGGVLVPTPRAQDLDVRALARQTGRDVAVVARRLLVGAAAEGGQVPVAR
jgi:NAD(P)H dehydrogenase (quinone)